MVSMKKTPLSSIFYDLLKTKFSPVPGGMNKEVFLQYKTVRNKSQNFLKELSKIYLSN